MNTVSLPADTPEAITKVFNATNVRVVFDDTTSWLERARRLAQADPTKGSQRIRLIGDDETDETIKATAQTPEIAVYRQPVTSAGRLEMLPFLREQAVTMTAHRFGTINDLPQRALGD